MKKKSKITGVIILYLKDTEPEVNITTTPQSSESELDETSSLDNNSDEENSSLPPIQTQDLHKSNGIPPSCGLPQTLHHSKNLQQSQIGIQQFQHQRDIDQGQHLQKEQNQSDLSPSAEHLQSDVQQPPNYQQDYQTQQDDIVQQQTITLQQQTDQQQKQNIGNQDIPFDINTIIPKTTVKLEPGINSTENICSSEWNTFAPNASGNDVGELTTMQPFSYYKNAFDPNGQNIFFDQGHNYQIPNKNNNTLFDPMFSRLNEGDELHPFDTSAMQSSTNDNFQQNVKNAMYYGAEYTKTTQSGIDARCSAGPYPSQSLYNREPYVYANGVSRTKSCDEVDNHGAPNEEKVIVPEGKI